MQYEYGFEYEFPGAMEGAAEGMAAGVIGIATGIMLIVMFLLMGFSIVSYILNAVGTYRIAKRRGIHHAWLAWVPVGSEWLLGSISDHYQYVVSCVFLGTFTATIVAAVNMHSGRSSIALAVALMVIVYVAMLALAIAVLVLRYIASYDLFMSCKPDQAVLFLVLGVLFAVVMPFFVFSCSDADKGMPAKRPRQPEAPAEAAVDEIPVVEAEVVEDPEE